MSHFISWLHSLGPLLTSLTTYKNPVTTLHFRYLVDLYPQVNKLEACLAGAGSTGEASSVGDDETRTWFKDKELTNDKTRSPYMYDVTYVTTL